MQSTNKPKYLHVAVGVLRNSNGQILLSKRNRNAHQGRLWEFPGGKVESGENVQTALKRELKEEVDISVVSASRLIKIHHTYPDFRVCLDVWRVNQFSGTAKGMEGQIIRWVEVNNLSCFDFPDANLPIISAVKLPYYYAILDDAEGNMTVLRENFICLIERGIRLVQIRAKALASEKFSELAIWACQYGIQRGITVLLNAAPCLSQKLNAGGVHLNSSRLMQLDTRPQDKGIWVAASCHNRAQLVQAEKLGLDFVVLSPVRPTSSHPGDDVLGWSGFKVLAENVNLPVYALGGVGPDDLHSAQNHGGQGIAGIRAFLR